MTLKIQKSLPSLCYLLTGRFVPILLWHVFKSYHIRLFLLSAQGIRRFALLGLAFITLGIAPSLALEPIVIGEGQDQIDITLAGELYEGRGDSLQIETASGANRISGRMTVQARTAGTNPNWVVFALSNPTDKRIERWLTADRYSIINSGVLWSNLDTGYIAQVTPSLGFRPEKVPNDDVDIFKIELEPGATVTFVVELVSDRFPRLYLWKARTFEQKLRNITLFHGILLGVTGLLAVFLTAVFVANHKAVFPATALVAWAVTAYLCVDFGFWHKLFQLQPEDNAMYRAAAEAAIATSLVLFLYTFLRLSLWHRWIRIVFLLWAGAQSLLILFAVIDAPVAAGLARLSILFIALVCSVLIFYLALRGQDRALSLVPSWLLFLVWVFACAVTIQGQVSGDIFVAGIVSGLVLIVLLFGFTVTQFAFRSGDAAHSGISTKLQPGSLALQGAGATIWEWHAKRDKITVSEEIDDSLGYMPGTLSCRVDEWIKYLHQADLDRFKMLLSSIEENNGGDMRLEFRLRRADNSYAWYELWANSAPATQYRSLKCAGIMRDITHTKQSHERLMHDAIHDSLTNLPNRELFLDRLETAVTRTQEEGANRPIVIFIDIDRFKSLNASFGFGVGDTMLLIVARRLARHLSPLDTLARIGGDQFAIILVTETEAQQIAMLAERVRRSLRSPMKISGKEIVLTGSIGISVFDGHQTSHKDLLSEAEMAMYRAKRSGTDRIEMFSPSMRNEQDDRIAMEADLRRALDKGQIKVLYQPVMYLEDYEELAGFEALMVWEHPRLGLLHAHDFISVAEDSGLIGQLGSYVLDRASRQAAKWQKILPKTEDPLFVSVDISSRRVFRHDLIKDFHLILKREILPKGSLRLAIAEELVMENPEQASEILEWLKGAGASLLLDRFGAGYSSLSYLNRFPFDVIRIDKTLIEDSDVDSSAAVIVRSIIKLSHELGKDVAAEGVHTKEEADLLYSLNCEYVQGSYYSDPMTEKEVVGLLNTIKKSNKKWLKQKKDKHKAQKAQPAQVSKPGLEVARQHMPPQHFNSPQPVYALSHDQLSSKHKPAHTALPGVTASATRSSFERADIKSIGSVNNGETVLSSPYVNSSYGDSSYADSRQIGAGQSYVKASLDIAQTQTQTQTQTQAQTTLTGQPVSTDYRSDRLEEHEQPILKRKGKPLNAGGEDEIDALDQSKNIELQSSIYKITEDGSEVSLEEFSMHSHQPDVEIDAGFDDLESFAEHDMEEGQNEVLRSEYQKQSPNVSSVQPTSSVRSDIQDDQLGQSDDDMLSETNLSDPMISEPFISDPVQMDSAVNEGDLQKKPYAADTYIEAKHVKDGRSDSTKRSAIRQKQVDSSASEKVSPLNKEDEAVPSHILDSLDN